MKVEVQKISTMIEVSEARIGQPWTAEDHARLVHHLHLVDELAQAVCASRGESAALGPITAADFDALRRRA